MLERKQVKRHDAVIGKRKRGSIYHEREFNHVVYRAPAAGASAKARKAADKAFQEWKALVLARRDVADDAERMAAAVILEFGNSTEAIERIAVAEARLLADAAAGLTAAIEAADVHCVAEAAHRVGFQQCRVEVVLDSPHFRRGFRNIVKAAEGGHVSHDKHRVTVAERNAERVKEFERVKAIVKSGRRAARLAARKCGCSYSTIMRAVNDAKKPR